MEINEFKCAVCQKKYSKKQVMELKEKLLKSFDLRRRAFNQDDDFDEACSTVEKVFDDFFEKCQ